MAPPTKLTRETSAAIVAAVRTGSTAKEAAECAGVDEATLYRWLQRARAGRGPYAAFARRLAAARVAHEAAVEEEFRRRREERLRQLAVVHELSLQATLARLRL